MGCCGQGIGAGQVLHAKLGKKPFMDLCFGHGGIVTLEQERAFPKLLPQSRSSRMLQLVVVF